MDGFGDNFVPNGEGSAPAVDPAADFLAREQQVLSGLEEPAAAATPPIEAASEPAAQTDDFAFEDTPANTEENGELAATIAAPAEEVAAASPQRTPERVVTPVPKVEPEAIRIWREEHQKQLIEKDAAEEEAKAALKEKAKQELADWYKQHEEQVAKTRQANRCAEKELVADTERPEPGTEWERISKLCDFNPKVAKSSRDVSRMRSIILRVKQSPPVKA